MVSEKKILLHRERVEKYLKNEPIYPVTLELGVTADCNRNCTDCPSSRGDRTFSLDMDLIIRLFKLLSGHTRGIIITGGEPTLHPDFPEILNAANDHGFRDITVVTNGHSLGERRISDALIKFGAAVRVSLYDWDGSDLCGMEPTLNRIQQLKKQIIKSQSKLQIGISALTREENLHVLEEVVRRCLDHGANWLYFHPTCTGNTDGTPPQRLNQQTVLNHFKSKKFSSGGRFPVHFLVKRFDDKEIRFSGYHAAHFILVLGADGKNYLATEAKYRPEYCLWDLKNNWNDNFLFHDDRTRLIQSITSETYPLQGSRNRGILYNHLIQEIIEGKKQMDFPQWGSFTLPHII